MNTLFFFASHSRLSSGCRVLVEFGAFVFAAHCYFISPQKYFAIDSPGDSPTYSKQRMNKISPHQVLYSCVAWKPKLMHDDVMLNGII